MAQRQAKRISVAAPELAAHSAGLVYVNDATAGIRRLRAGRGFRYVTPQGRTLRAAAEIDRIRRLVIPPAWREVWICPDPDGHVQATGRDARGRKQYRYHAQWRVVRDCSKYGNLLKFGAALPGLRHRIALDLARQGLGKQKVMAAVVYLLEKTMIRVGNEEYARSNGSFGLTTLEDCHVTISGDGMRFHFKGKSGKVHDVTFQDRRLARIVRQCRALPGQQLFQFRDDAGKVCDVGSSDVNEYLREVMGGAFTAKDFRTWTGTILAAHALQELPRYLTKADATRNIRKAVEAVAALLGNTPAVCRKSYIHPAVTDGYFDGTLLRSSLARVSRNGNGKAGELAKTEAAVLRLLRKLPRTA